MGLKMKSVHVNKQYTFENKKGNIVEPQFEFDTLEEAKIKLKELRNSKIVNLKNGSHYEPGLIGKIKKFIFGEYVVTGRDYYWSIKEKERIIPKEKVDINTMDLWCDIEERFLNSPFCFTHFIYCKATHLWKNKNNKKK